MNDASIQSLINHLVSAFPHIHFNRSGGFNCITGLFPRSGDKCIEVAFGYADEKYRITITGYLRHQGDDIWQTQEELPPSTTHDEIVAHIKRVLRAIRVSPDYLATEDPPVTYPLSIREVFCYWPISADSDERKPIPPKYIFTTEKAALAQFDSDCLRLPPKIMPRIPFIPAAPIRERATTAEEEARADRERAKAAALAKLTPAERELLGL